MRQVTVAGHICVDLIPRLPDGVAVIPGAIVEIGPLTIQPGGSVYNTGTALAALGVEVMAVATIGDDPLGKIVRERVHGKGITTRFVVAPGGATPYSIVVERARYDRAFLHHVGTAANFTGHEVDSIDTPLFHLGYPPVLPGLVADEGAPMESLFRRARKAGASTSLDLSVLDPSSPLASFDWQRIMARTLPYVDIISPSIDDLVSIGLGAGTSPDDVRNAARTLLSGGAAVVLLSAGANGAFLATAASTRLAAGGSVVAALPDEWSHVEMWIEPETVPVLATTNGAGDTMTAGLLYGLLAGWAPEAAGHFAARLAAAKIQGQDLATALDRFRWSTPAQPASPEQP